MKGRKGYILSKGALKELMRKAGAEGISSESVEALRDFLMDLGLKISRDAILFCRHAGRKTVKKEDVEMAKSRMKL